MESEGDRIKKTFASDGLAAMKRKSTWTEHESRIGDRDASHKRRRRDLNTNQWG